MFTDCPRMLSRYICAFRSIFHTDAAPFSELQGNLSFLSLLDCLLFIKSSIKHQSCHRSRTLFDTALNSVFSSWLRVDGLFSVFESWRAVRQVIKYILHQNKQKKDTSVQNAGLSGVYRGRPPARSTFSCSDRETEAMQGPEGYKINGR